MRSVSRTRTAASAMAGMEGSRSAAASPPSAAPAMNSAGSRIHWTG